MAGYNDTLASNNVDLQSILDKVNALPEAGSGGGSGDGENVVCTVEILADVPVQATVLTYLNENFEF